MDQPSFYDQKWQTAMIASADGLATTARTLRDYKAPSDAAWQTFEKTFDASLDQYIEAMALIKTGVRNTNPSAINDATALLLAANRGIGTATGLIPK